MNPEPQHYNGQPEPLDEGAIQSMHVDWTDEIVSLSCPITQMPFDDPVIAADGHTYERAAIEHWLLHPGPRKSPMTGAMLAHKHLTPNNTIRSLMDELKNLRDNKYIRNALATALKACDLNESPLLTTKATKPKRQSAFTRWADRTAFAAYGSVSRSALPREQVRVPTAAVSAECEAAVVWRRGIASSNLIGSAPQGAPASVQLLPPNSSNGQQQLDVISPAPSESGNWRRGPRLNVAPAQRMCG